ncbi:hypothetical protein E4T39_01768 [Aureobasidium subglaciale]|nr:hypothetical protein E4T39_01768 [Aureobasidium subglaciale]
MGNKVAVSFGIVMAIFIVLALTIFSFSAFRHSRRNTAAHRQHHDARLDQWISRVKRRTWLPPSNNHVDRDVEMQVPIVTPAVPRRPENVHVRTGPARVSRMNKVFDLALSKSAQRVEFCNAPLDMLPRTQHGVVPAGFV